jgi:CRP-like cAMP-binding protein
MMAVSWEHIAVACGMGVRHPSSEHHHLSAGAELLDRMAAAASVRTFNRNERIWRAGDAPQSITLVKSGLLKLVRPAARGRSAICGLFGPPDTVGDIAVLRSIPYPADAIVATETASVVSIPAAFVREGLGKSPELAVSLACSVHSKLVHSTTRSTF